MAFFPKNVNRRLKTLPFQWLTTRVSAALKNYARKEPLLARYILKPVQLVHRTKIDQSKKNHILICQDPRCIKKKNYFFHIHIALSLECNKCFSKVSWQTARISNSPARPTWPIAVLHHTSKMATNKHFPSTVYRRDTANIAVKLRARPDKSRTKCSAVRNIEILLTTMYFTFLTQSSVQHSVFYIKLHEM